MSGRGTTGLRSSNRNMTYGDWNTPVSLEYVHKAIALGRAKYLQIARTVLSPLRGWTADGGRPHTF
jgi:hypothetical protein